MNSTDLAVTAVTDFLATIAELTRLWSNASLIAGCMLLYFDLLVGFLFILIGVVARLGMYASLAGYDRITPA